MSRQGFRFVRSAAPIELWIHQGRGEFGVRHAARDAFFRYSGEPDEDSFEEVAHLVRRIEALRARLVKDDADRAEIAHLRFRLERLGLEV